MAPRKFGLNKTIAGIAQWHSHEFLPMQSPVLVPLWISARLRHHDQLMRMIGLRPNTMATGGARALIVGFPAPLLFCRGVAFCIIVHNGAINGFLDVDC